MPFIGYAESRCESCGCLIICDPQEAPAPNCCDNCRKELDKIKKKRTWK